MNGSNERGRRELEDAWGRTFKRKLRRSSVAWRVYRRVRMVIVGYGRRKIDKVIDWIWGAPW